MKKTERLFNTFFGLSLVYWGVAGLFENSNIYDTPYIRFFITLLNILVGFLIIFREPILKKTSLNSILISLPSLICGGLLFKLSNPLLLWNTYTEILFIFGGMFTLTSFLFLGKSFAIFPGTRTIVSNGLFRLIRHPAYLGESMMMTSCLLEAENIISLIPFVIFTPGLIIRIREEERILSKNIIYNRYKEQVRWRLIPYLW
jgi:protein-S-isoprenylcysteine O-methyltransferase Ste14